MLLRQCKTYFMCMWVLRRSGILRALFGSSSTNQSAQYPNLTRFLLLLTVFENGMLRRMCGHSRVEVGQERRQVPTEKLHTLHSHATDKRDAYNILVGGHEKKSYHKTRTRQEYNINLNLK